MSPWDIESLNASTDVLGKGQSSEKTTELSTQ